jgi:hypothetical protein
VQKVEKRDKQPEVISESGDFQVWWRRRRLTDSWEESADMKSDDMKMVPPIWLEAEGHSWSNFSPIGDKTKEDRKWHI